MISRVGVALVSIGCCLGRMLHRRSRGILAIALVIVGVCFSTLALRHLVAVLGRVGEIFKVRDAIWPTVYYFNTSFQTVK